MSQSLHCVLKSASVNGVKILFLYGYCHATNERNVIVLKKSCAFLSQVSPFAPENVTRVLCENNLQDFYCEIIQSWLRDERPPINTGRKSVTFLPQLLTDCCTKLVLTS